MRDRSAALLAFAALGLGPACTSPKPTGDSGPGTLDSGDTDSGDSGDSDSGDTDSGDTDSGDTGVPEVCVTATSTASPEVGTVVTVRWDSDAPGPSVVEYGPDTA